MATIGDRLRRRTLAYEMAIHLLGQSNRSNRFAMKLEVDQQIVER